MFDINREFNTYGGCHPGKAIEQGGCPWYPSKTGEPHCESSANFAGIHALRETSELCCNQHFSYLDQATCVQSSKADVEAEEVKVAQDLARTKFFYPDMHGKKNCVFNSDYDDWMMGAVSSNSSKISFRQLRYHEADQLTIDLSFCGDPERRALPL